MPKISDYTVKATPDGTEKIPISQGNKTVRTTAQGIADVTGATLPPMIMATFSGSEALNTFTSGAYRTIDLNTLDIDTDSLASLASDQLTIPAGTYWCDSYCACSDGTFTKFRVYDVTGSAVLATGYNSRKSTESHETVAQLQGIFTVSVSSAIEIQGKGTNNFTARNQTAHGVAADSVHRYLHLWKIG